MYCYIHIPFCASKCKYCRFASFGQIDRLKIDLYVNKLILEIESSRIDFKELKSIYFGGGTPSSLTVSQLNLIISTLKNKYTFAENIEINLEATPTTINKKNLIGWKNIGINRLSIGVQTLNNNSLIEIGRGKKGDIINALNVVKTSPQPSPSQEREQKQLYISVDFIIGLPYVKKGEIKKNIEYILDNYTFIKHISVYMLEEYYKVPDDKDSKFENIVYPNNWDKLGIDEKEYLGEYIEVKKYLKEKGFNSYEISNFTKSGFECKHNSAYWNHSEMLAFGLGAHGLISGKRYNNSEDFLGYYSGKKNIEESLNQDDLFLEKLMFQLRTSGIEKKIYDKLNQEKISQFIKEGYFKYENDFLKLKDKGILVMDYLLGEII